VSVAYEVDSTTHVGQQAVVVDCTSMFDRQVSGVDSTPVSAPRVSHVT